MGRAIKNFLYGMGSSIALIPPSIDQPIGAGIMPRNDHDAMTLDWLIVAEEMHNAINRYQTIASRHVEIAARQTAEAAI
jgi:hypothetical protein